MSLLTQIKSVFGTRGGVDIGTVEEKAKSILEDFRTESVLRGGMGASNRFDVKIEGAEMFRDKLLVELRSKGKR